MDISTHSIKNIKKYYPKVSILVISTHPEHLYALKAIKAGASGYINKSQPLEDYLTAVEMVLDGKPNFIYYKKRIQANQLFTEYMDLEDPALSQQELIDDATMTPMKE